MSDAPKGYSYVGARRAQFLEELHKPENAAILVTADGLRVMLKALELYQAFDISNEEHDKVADITTCLQRLKEDAFG
jgi:hypothetical protein